MIMTRQGLLQKMFGKLGGAMVEEILNLVSGILVLLFLIFAIVELHADRWVQSIWCLAFVTAMNASKAYWKVCEIEKRLKMIATDEMMESHYSDEGDIISAGDGDY